MKLIKIHMVILLVILLGVSEFLYAQKSRKNKPDDHAWIIGAKTGANITFGDIKYWDYIPNFEYGELTYGYGISVGKLLSPKFSIKGDFQYAFLSGTKRTNSLYRTFKTKSQSASLIFQMNIFQLFKNRPRIYRLSMWGDVGLGYSRWQSLLYNRKTQDTLENLNWGTKKYENSLFLPIGLNIRYYLNKNISVDAHSSLNFVNSDWLDAKEGGIAFDYYWYTGLGFNYHFNIQKSIRKVPIELKSESKDFILLDYINYDPFNDPEIKRISKKEYLEQEEAKAAEAISSSNPYILELWVPELANNNSFQVLVTIKKRGIIGNGFFRFKLPTGFVPHNPVINEVSYTKIGDQYDFDFYLPMNKDTLNIPLRIDISNREEGTYPLFLEGEIMNQEGEIFPLKSVQYVQIKSGVEYNQVPVPDNDTRIRAEEADADYVAPKNVTKEWVESDGDKTYRIQILACRKPSSSVNEFLKKHQIDQKVFLYEAGGWWRYSIYSLNSLKDAEKFLLMVRNKHLVKEAFIVSFENGEREVPKNQPSRDITSYEEMVPVKSNIEHTSYPEKQFTPTESKTTQNTPATNNSQTKKEEDIKTTQTPQFEQLVENQNISVYRIEIAVSPAAPIPFRQLQNWVANEKISEWTYNKSYRYTIGRFENEQVARAFLQYVRMQFALPDAHLVETQGKIWLRVVR